MTATDVLSGAVYVSVANRPGLVYLSEDDEVGDCEITLTPTEARLLAAALNAHADAAEEQREDAA